MIKTFRAKSIQEALRLVRQEFGDDAAVLHTRRLNPGLIGRWVKGAQIEVAATANEASPIAVAASLGGNDCLAQDNIVSEPLQSSLGVLGDENNAELASPTYFEPLAEETTEENPPTALFGALTSLVESGIDESISRELLDALRGSAPTEDLSNPGRLLSALQEAVAGQFSTSGPIEAGQGSRQTVALVGPTGVGKTTTIAKLAANFRLREKLNVGLITVDTYRVAAVEQLRTYADIIDLPMEVVATPREMRDAKRKFADLDLVLLDTAGRSPRDEVKLQELKSILGVAQPDAVHLVLSATTSATSLLATASQFAPVGLTSLLLTKLDEAPALGHFVSLVRGCDLPLSYLTNGQTVPDDIAVADAANLATTILQGAA